MLLVLTSYAWLISTALTAAAVPRPPESIPCTNLQTAQDISVPELRGGWVALESMSTMKKGIEKSAICVHSEIVNATTSSLTMLSELHRPNTEDIEIARNDFKVFEGESGRWEIISDQPQLAGAEMLIISAEPSSHLLVALCLPFPQMQQNTTKYLSSLNLLSRRYERGSRGVLTSRDIRQIKGSIQKKLRSSFGAMEYDTSC